MHKDVRERLIQRLVSQDLSITLFRSLHIRIAMAVEKMEVFRCRSPILVAINLVSPPTLWLSRRLTVLPEVARLRPLTCRTVLTQCGSNRLVRDHSARRRSVIR